jgi:hypothetical protein
MSSATLQNDPSVKALFNVGKSKPLALFEYLALCLRLVVAITNYECVDNDNPGSTIITE